MSRRKEPTETMQHSLRHHPGSNNQLDSFGKTAYRKGHSWPNDSGSPVRPRIRGAYGHNPKSRHSCPRPADTAAKPVSHQSGPATNHCKSSSTTATCYLKPTTTTTRIASTILRSNCPARPPSPGSVRTTSTAKILITSSWKCSQKCSNI